MTDPLKVLPDFSFVRDGVPIEACLRDLVADSSPVRHTAGGRLQAMQMGLPSIHTDFATLDLSAYGVGMPGQGERFDEAIRAAVTEPAFDMADFARRLCAFKIALKQDWFCRVDISMDRMHAQDAKFDRLAEPVVETIKTAGKNTVAREQAEHRFARIVRAYVCGSVRDIGTKADPYVGAESTAPAGVMAFHVFCALGRELLSAPEGLHALLDEQGMADEALSALERAGPAAVAFVPRLLARLDELPRRRNHSGGSAYFDADRALGSIARGDGTTVDALVARLDHGDPHVCTAAAMSLRAMNGNLAGRNGVIVERLMQPPATPSNSDPWPDVVTLASAGRDDPAVHSLVAKQLRARPPEMVANPDYPDYPSDRVMYERGAAIEATAYLTAYPDLFLPLLIDALDTFEEYDPDQSYSGPCGRVSDALARFGRAAAEAAVPLARHVGTPENNELARSVLDALAAIGPAARDALPLLDAYRRARADDDEPLPDLDAGPIDPTDDPVGAIMQKIRAGM